VSPFRMLLSLAYASLACGAVIVLAFEEGGLWWAALPVSLVITAAIGALVQGEVEALRKAADR
jgi:hypothetical protein